MQRSNYRERRNSGKAVGTGFPRPCGGRAAAARGAGGQRCEGVKSYRSWAIAALIGVQLVVLVGLIALLLRLFGII